MLTAGSLTPLPSFAANGLIGASLVGAALVGIPVACAIARDGYKKTKIAVETRDLEGVAHQGMWCGMGVSYAGLSGLLGAAGIYSLQGKVAPAFITPAITAGGGAMYGLLLVYGLHGLTKVTKFKSKLNQLEGREALQWLNQQIALTPQEMTIAPEAREKLLQKKWNQFVLRTDAACLAKVKEKLPALLENNDPIAANELIQGVKKACFKQQVKYILLLALAVIGIAASVCVLVLSGPASPLLFAIGALLWFTVDSSKFHNYLGEKFWTWIGQEPQVLLPQPIQR
jgi:hypothetical protein